MKVTAVTTTHGLTIIGQEISNEDGTITLKDCVKIVETGGGMALADFPLPMLFGAMDVQIKTSDTLAIAVDGEAKKMYDRFMQQRSAAVSGIITSPGKAGMLNIPSMPRTR